MARQYFLAVTAGACVLLAFPPAGISSMAWIGILPLLWMLKKSSNLAHSMGLSFAFGLVLMGGFHSWIWTLVTFGPMWGIGGLWLLYSLYLASFYALFGSIAYGLRKTQGSLYALGISAGYVLTEFLRQWGPIGSPGGILGYSQINSSIAPLASWTGIWGVSFIVILFPSLLLGYGIPQTSASCERNPTQKKSFILATACLCLLIIISTFTKIPHETGTVIASSIQGSHAQNSKFQSTNTTIIQDFYIKNTNNAILKGAEVIVWPETITAVINTENNAFMTRLQNSLLPSTTVFWGTPTRQNNHFYNSIVMTTKDSAQADIYNKHHLVPFGEYWPLKSWFQKLGLSNLIPGAEYSPGTHSGALFSTHFSGAICLESVYGNHFRPQVQAGSQGFIISGNHAWYGDSRAAEKHLDMLRFRAIEYQRSIAFATNSGISALILPNGILAAVAQSHQEAVLVAKLPLQTNLTVYAQYGEWFLRICIVTVILGLLSTFKKRFTI